MKRWGFLTGVLIGAIVVWVFNAVRHVDDDDRLSQVLKDHCLPYVMDGTVPFQSTGRAPGVYDDVDLRDTLFDDGARLIFDQRFTAQWGVLRRGEADIRMCEVKPTYGENTAPAFAIETDGMLERYSALLGLETDANAAPIGPVAILWAPPEAPLGQGLRVVMIVAPSAVSRLLVSKDIGG